MERWSGRPAKSRHSPFSPFFLCPSASSQICTTLLFLFPFLYVQGTVPFSTLTLDYIWWPQCLAHKRCSLCEQEGRAHALSFSVLCGVTASLAFLVFSFSCVFFFFGNIMGIVCKTHCTASLSCGSAHGPSPLDLLSHPPLECTAGSFQMSHSKSTAVCRLLHCGALPAKRGEYLHHYGHVFHMTIFNGHGYTSWDWQNR